MIRLGPAPSADPSPMTREGARALVERFYAMKGLGAGTSMPEVGVGEPGAVGGSTSPLTPGPKNSKSALDRAESFPDDVIQLEILPAEKRKTEWVCRTALSVWAHADDSRDISPRDSGE